MDAWAAWIERELPVADAGGRARALAAAQAILDRGGTPPDAALAAALAALEPRGALTPEAIAEARGQLEAQRQAAAALRVAAAPPSPPPVAQAAPAAPAVPGPSLRELFSENSVLLLGLTGAFLLVVATVLFELYGASQFDGWVRFGAVAGLAAAFGLAGGVCLGTRRLRVVGQVYLGVFALMVPLSAVAAYTFLDLGRQGITIPTAVGLTGLACAVLYAVLCVRMQAAPYAWLACLALLAGWTGGSIAVAGESWAGLAIAPLVVVYAVLASDGPRQFRVPSGAAMFATWAPALRLSLGPGLGLVAPDLAVAGIEFVAVSTVLVAMAWARSLGRNTGAALRVSAGVGIGAAAVLPATQAQPQSLALVAGTVLLVVVAIRQRNPLWLAAATPVLVMAWYWSAVAFLPPPANPGPDTLAQLFAPLPALLGAAGLALRVRLSPRWGYALLLPAALGGFVVAVLAGASGDAQLAGAALLVYGALAYLGGALGRSAGDLSAGLVGIAAGTLALLGSRNEPAAGYVLVAAVGCALIYGLQEAWRGVPRLAAVHRAFGLGGLALLAGIDLLVPDLYARHGSAAVAAALAALVLASTLAAEARLNRHPIADYGALVAAGLAAVWLAGWLGAGDALWYVLGPGLALMAGGLRMPYDRRLPRRPLLDRTLVAAGAATLLGPEAVQVLQPDDLAGPHLARLLGGGVAGLLAGIGLRSRVLVVTGTLAVALAALRALFIALESVQPYVLFGAVALLLLAAAAVLAGLRERFGGARSAMASSWADWN